MAGTTIFISRTASWLPFRTDPKMNEPLKKHIEQAILPRYEHFDRAHGPEHARTVIEQSLALARHYQVDRQMVYAIAAYHDVGLEKGREMHHIHSGEILAADTKLRQWFSPQQIAVMREAVRPPRLVGPRTPHDLRTHRCRSRPLYRPTDHRPPHDTIRAGELSGAGPRGSISPLCRSPDT